MDSFEERLKRDAAAVRADVSPELEGRLRASLEGAAAAKPGARSGRPAWFWLASSLTGTAAALVVIALLNREEPAAPPAGIAAQPFLSVPNLDVRPAMLGPLEDELDKLKSDLEKAERVVRDDVETLLGEVPR